MKGHERQCRWIHRRRPGASQHCFGLIQDVDENIPMIKIMIFEYTQERVSAPSLMPTNTALSHHQGMPKMQGHSHSSIDLV